MADYTTTTADILTPPGRYAATTNVVSSGSVTLSYKVDTRPEQDIDDASWSANATKTIDLPLCRLTITITGDASFSLLPLPN